VQVVCAHNAYRKSTAVNSFRGITHVLQEYVLRVRRTEYFTPDVQSQFKQTHHMRRTVIFSDVYDTYSKACSGITHILRPLRALSFHTSVLDLPETTLETVSYFKASREHSYLHFNAICWASNKVIPRKRAMTLRPH
jgi:hypothetical protein